MRLLVVNAGSSSLKLSVLESDDDPAGRQLRTVASAQLAAPASGVDVEGLTRFVDARRPVDAVGHRVVHGGTEFTGPVVVDADVRRRLGALADLAPLHQPVSLQAMDAVAGILPGTPAVACFDTAFHASMDPAASTYAIPPEWRRRWPLRRYGFHGLSVAYASDRAAQLVGAPAATLRTVVCHLGSGASVTAVTCGRSVDTTMGFTPLEGLVMATRSGSVDPGLILWLQTSGGMPAAELADTLERRSGLLALAGSPDLHTVLAAEAGHDPDAALAVAVYLHRLRAAVAAMVAAMGGLDVLAFTGGVGEHAPAIRGRACAGLGFLGVAVDPVRNEGAAGDAEVSAPGSTVRVLVVASREDLQIAREMVGLLG